MRFQADLTPVKSYECRKLSSMIKENGESVYKALEMLLANLAIQINVKYNLEPYQAPDIARAIYKKYYFYSVEEIAIVLRMGADGELGQIYDRLSKDIILKWFVEYDSRFRDPLVNNSRQQMNNEYEQGQDEIANVLSPVIDKILKNMEEESQREENYQIFKDEYYKKKNGEQTE